MIGNLHIGQVTQNDDPNLQGRIRVLCASLFGIGVLSNWIDYVGPAGLYSLPNLGDKVAIIAENNDPRYCHFLGVSQARMKRDGVSMSFPSPFDTSLPGTQIALITKSGTYILLDDTSDSVTIYATETSVLGDLTVSGDVTLTNGDLTIETGDLNVLLGDVVAGTISLKLHTHSGVQTGGGISGPPVP